MKPDVKSILAYILRHFQEKRVTVFDYELREKIKKAGRERAEKAGGRK